VITISLVPCFPDFRCDRQGTTVHKSLAPHRLLLVGCAWNVGRTNLIEWSFSKIDAVSVPYPWTTPPCTVPESEPVGSGYCSPTRRRLCVTTTIKRPLFLFVLTWINSVSCRPRRKSTSRSTWSLLRSRQINLAYFEL
jgi:hypothetical protein